MEIGTEIREKPGFPADSIIRKAIDSDNCEDCPAAPRTLNSARRNNVRTATIAPIAKKRSNDSLRNTYSLAMLQAANAVVIA